MEFLEEGRIDKYEIWRAGSILLNELEEPNEDLDEYRWRDWRILEKSKNNSVLEERQHLKSLII